MALTSRRNLSRGGNARKKFVRGDLERQVAINVRQLMKEHDPTIRRPALDLGGQVAGLVASYIAVFTQAQQRALKAHTLDVEGLSEDFVARLIAQAEREFGSPKLTVPIPPPPSAAIEIGTSVDWAGPVGGPTLLEKHFGISRSTLFRWQRRNDVIALRTGGKRHVFPLRQFVDARPVPGLAKVLTKIPDPRRAWLWLISPSDEFQGASPIDRLNNHDFTVLETLANPTEQTCP